MEEEADKVRLSVAVKVQVSLREVLYNSLIKLQ